MLDDRIISKYVPVREQVADILRKMITTGKLIPGEKLNEREISEKLNISTTPVKEALRLLESEGLIYTVARKGSFVSDFSADHIKQVIYARSALEGTAAYFSTAAIDADGIRQLESILRESHECKENRDIDGFCRCNSRFHQFLRSNCKNEYLNRMVDILRAMDKTSLNMTLKKSENEFELSYQEHTAILEAIRKKDCEKVEKCVVAHIRRTANKALGEE